MLRVAGLHHHARRAPVPSRTAGDLDHQREGAFRRAVVGEMQRQIGIDHTNACDSGKVEAARHELRAHQDVSAPFAERLPDVEVRVGSPCRIAVEAQHARSRPQLLDDALETLRPHPHAADIPAAAVVAHRRHLARVTAVVAHQAIDFRVLNKRHRAAQALNRFAAVAAQHKRAHAAPVQIEDHLLLVFESALNHLDQPPRQRLPVARRGLIAHVDELDLGIPAAHPPLQLGQSQHALCRLVVRDNAGRCGAGDQPRPSQRREAPGDPSRLVPGGAVLLIRRSPLLVEADQAQPRDRREHRRPATEHHLGLSATSPPPLLGPFELGELAVQDGNRGFEASAHALDQLRRQ